MTCVLRRVRLKETLIAVAQETLPKRRVLRVFDWGSVLGRPDSLLSEFRLERSLDMGELSTLPLIHPCLTRVHREQSYNHEYRLAEYIYSLNGPSRIDDEDLDPTVE